MKKKRQRKETDKYVRMAISTASVDKIFTRKICNSPQKEAYELVLSVNYEGDVIRCSCIYELGDVDTINRIGVGTKIRMDVKKFKDTSICIIESLKVLPT